MVQKSRLKDLIVTDNPFPPDKKKKEKRPKNKIFYIFIFGQKILKIQ